MSLNLMQMRRASAELRANLDRSGLTPLEVQTDLGFTAVRLRRALHMRPGTNGSDIWLLRDYLEQAVRDSGGNPVPYTVLTEESRKQARTWFTLHPAPHHNFAAPPRP